MRAGATNFVLDTATGLQARGYPVVIVTGQADSEIVGERKLEIVELGGPLPSDPRHWLGLAGLERRVFAALDRIRHKILFPQVHPANYWAFAYKAARPWVPCVWMCHEPSAFVHSWSNIRSLQGPMRLATMAVNPALQVIDRLLVAQADYIIANSRFTAANVRRIYGHEVNAIAYPPVDPTAFSGPSVQRDCILSLGRLTRFKRVDLAIQGYALARRELGDALPTFIIAGTGPELPALRALVAASGLAHHVCFAGEVNDEEKRALYARALLFVATAAGEPFGMVCTEAMAAGAPMLVPDHGGPSEIMVDGQTGALYRSCDAGHLARKLVSLLSNPAGLDRLSAGARLRAQTSYSTERTIDSLDEALRGVAGMTR
jgi:glycosyltransferase involved in cell wall biosynthesis